MKTSERIKELMIEKGLTAYHLAKETGISQATLSRILNKESKPNTNTLKILSKYFDKNKDWLLTGRGDMLRDAAPETPGSPCADRLAECRAEVARLHDRLAEAQAQVSRLIEKL